MKPAPRSAAPITIPKMPARGPSFAVTNAAIVRAKVGGKIPDPNGNGKVISGLAPGVGEPHPYLAPPNVGVAGPA